MTTYTLSSFAAPAPLSRPKLCLPSHLRLVFLRHQPCHPSRTGSPASLLAGAGSGGPAFAFVVVSVVASRSTPGLGSLPYSGTKAKSRSSATAPCQQAGRGPRARRMTRLGLARVPSIPTEDGRRTLGAFHGRRDDSLWVRLVRYRGDDGHGWESEERAPGQAPARASCRVDRRR